MAEFIFSVLLSLSFSGGLMVLLLFFLCALLQKQVNAARKKKPSHALTCGDIDSHALLIMQSNGDWDCISFMLPCMTKKGIQAVVSCYNSKHGENEKRVKDYY